jgi:CYTH domain-containing protein
MLSPKEQSLTHAPATQPLSEEAMVTHEIERKWIVPTLPPLETLTPKHISQGYVEISSEGREVRVRSTGEHFYLTEKSGGGLIREEKESHISREEFERLWAQTEGRRVEKDRYVIPHGDSTIELDVYRGSLSGLVVAEVEFSTLRASGQFEAPAWFGLEVTEDARYKNKNLAVKGIPAA